MPERRAPDTAERPSPVGQTAPPADDAMLKSARRVRRNVEEERQARLAFLGTLAAGLAHEIRSPLEAIKLNAELLSEDIGCVHEGHRKEFENRLERVKREAEQLKKTLDEFLAFARPPKIEVFPTDINAYLRELIEFAEPEFRAAHINVVTDFADGLYPVAIDQAQMGQAVMNILANAREAIREHGEVRVATRETEKHVEIRIRDNGGGVKPELEEKIFEVFFTTRERGTGLGLGIARRVVEEHEGALILENRPGVGAEFIIQIPKGRYLEYSDAAAGAEKAK